MAVRAFTDRPKGLLRMIQNRADEGSLPDWEMDDDGDLTYARFPWKGRAWMRPTVAEGRVTFNIVGREGGSVTTKAYAFYHSRLLEMLLVSFDLHIDRVVVTPLPDPQDQID